jgi:CrcB protein
MFPKGPVALRNFFLVGIGGFLGAVTRYYLGGMVLRATGASRFPWGTLAVNVLGCFVMGLLAGVAERWHLLSPSARLLLFTGVLGGFTTFSAFAFETYFLGREHAWVTAAANIVLQVVAGVGMLWLGHLVASR